VLFFLDTFHYTFIYISRQSEREISPVPPPCPSPLHSLQLLFTTKLSLPIFTGAKIEAEKSSPLSICLVDSSTGFTISSGPEAFLKVEVVVLEGDFDLSEKDLSWSPEEFRSYVVKEREGRQPLLNGDACVELIHGVRSLGELSFTDNSSWTRSRRFRLGALAEDGYLNGLRIKEAVTEPFMVKDHRGECECLGTFNTSKCFLIILKNSELACSIIIIYSIICTNFLKP
jgi:Calmodulin binding protein-like